MYLRQRQIFTGIYYNNSNNKNNDSDECTSLT